MEGHNHNPGNLGWSILLNLVITAAEIAGGIASGSLSLLSDAGHNFSDVLSLVLSYFGEVISAKQASSRNSFGYKRVEIFTALINALSLWIVGIFIIIEAVRRLYSPENVSVGIMLIVAIVGLLGNLFSILILNKSKGDNLNMEAAYLHLFYDTISSVAVIAGAVIIYFSRAMMVDTVISVFIAGMIFWSGYGIIKKTLHILMQGVPERIDPDEVYKSIQGVKGVKNVHGLHIWSIDSNEIFLSCHVCADKKSAKWGSDELLLKINKVLMRRFGIHHTAIQMENNLLCKKDCCQ